MAGRYKLLNPLQVYREQERPEELSVQIAPDEQHNVLDVDGTEIIKERPVLVPLRDKGVMQAIGLVRQYLRDTGVTANMNKFTTALLQSKILPYNPYPGFVKRFQKLSQRFHTRRESLTTVRGRIAQCPTFLTGTGILSGVKLPDAKLWGLQHILTSINPKVLSKYRDIIKTCSVDSAKLKQKFGDDVALLSTMTGPCIFTGSLHDHCFKLDIGSPLVVMATDFQAAATTYGKAILCDIEHIFNQSDHLIVSLSTNLVTGDALQKKTWAASDLQSILTSENSQQKDSLTQMLGFGALKKQDATLQLLVNCGKDNQLPYKYIAAEKRYNLLTLIRGQQGQTTALYISSSPYQALHEGIFVEQSEAELYLNTFKKYSSSKSPLSQNVTGEVQKVWQAKIGGRQLESDLLYILHNHYLIERIQNQTKPATSKSEDTVAIQICRVLRGLGAKLEKITQTITSLHSIISSKFFHSNTELIEDVFNQCSGCLIEYFDESSHELSSVVLSAKHVVITTLTHIDNLLKVKGFNEVRPLLNFMKGYLKAISIGLVEDSLEEFPLIARTQSQIDQFQQTRFGQNLNIDMRTNAYRHKVETTMFTNVDQKRLDMSATNVNAPPQILPHAARMQYCMDIRIDEVWKDFMHSLLIARDNLPPNPYPSFVSKVRQASLKVQLFREDNLVISRKFLGSKPKIYDENLKIYSVPGISAFGAFSAVSALNNVGFRQIGTMASSAAISPPQPGTGTPAIAAGAFELKCYMALSNEALFYGSVTPHLTTITTNEYCFIKGSKTMEHDGILSLSKILLIHLGNLQAQGIIPLKAVFLDVEIELHDLNGISSRFQNQFTSTLNEQKTVLLHLLMPMDWRYVLIQKTIHVYYVNEMTDDVRFITKHDAALQYRQVFLNGNDCVEYMRRIQIYGKTEPDFIKNKMSEALKSFDWTSLALYTLSHALRNESDNIDQNKSELTTFCWKLYHSSSGALRYQISLNEALTEGLKYATNSQTSNTSLKDHLKSMLVGLRNFLNMSLTAQSTMTPSALNFYCQNLLQRAAPCDLTVGSVNLENFVGLSSTLFHISSLVQAISDSIAMDLVNCVPAVKQLMQN